MIDYINTNKFRDISDFVLWDKDYKPFTTNILKQDAIIWCKRDYIFELFKHLQFSGRNYILITGSSDYSVGVKEFLRKPKCIKKWYAQNINYVHPDLIAIPIGLSPNKDIDETPLDINWFVENIKKFRLIPKFKKTLYCNWTIQNNFSQRGNILEKFDKNNIKYKWDYPKFTNEQTQIIQAKFKKMKEGKSTKKEISTLLHYYDYCNEMSKYQFVVSPPGNGMDCHRTWEALYMGAFPIVIKNKMYKKFEDLPIIQVNNYSEVTYDLLYSYLKKEYNYQKLYMTYWINKINKINKTNE
jgi:hypothetical protein